jgi:hypothetical protein
MFVLRPVVYVAGRRARRAVVFLRCGVVVVLLVGLGCRRRVLPMAASLPRRDVFRALARLARGDVVAMAEGESGRDVLLMPEREARRERGAAVAGRSQALMLVMSACQAVRPGAR